MIVSGTPFIRIVIFNPLLNTRYPEEGSVLAVVDTGYEGFVAVPKDIFEKLRFNEMLLHKSTIVFPIGIVVHTTYTYGTVLLKDFNFEVEGPIETIDGLAEVIVGQDLLKYCKLEIDYCRRILSIEPCQ